MQVNLEKATPNETDIQITLVDMEFRKDVCIGWMNLFLLSDTASNPNCFPNGRRPYPIWMTTGDA